MAGQLRRAGLPAHPRYEAALRVFLAWPLRPMTVEDVYGELLKADEGVNFIGVYRIVHRLCEAGFLKQVMPSFSRGRAKHVFGLHGGAPSHAHADVVSPPGMDVAGHEGGIGDARKNLKNSDVLRRC